MPHPWDLMHVWKYSPNPLRPGLASVLQLQCIAKGLFGTEAAIYAQLQLDGLLRMLRH